MTENKKINRRILITGATGGLGIAMVQQFSAAGYIVTATGRSQRNIERIKSCDAKFIPADLTDHNTTKNLCENQDTIIHAAALSSSWDRPDNFYNINVKATKNLIEAAENAGCKNFIFISSPSIYAAMYDQFSLTENDIPNKSPLNDYAKTKLLAENLVIAANNNNFRTASIRPRAIVGPDDKVLLPKILEMIEKEKLPLLRKGQAVIELTDVRDIAKAVLLTERKMDDVHGQVFNISGGTPITVKDLAQKLANKLNYKIRFVPIPMFLAQVIAHALEWNGVIKNYKEEPKLTRYTLATLAYSQTFDLTQAREKLGFEPSFDALSTMLDVASRRRI